ncbi:uncharacterized protein LOC120250429 [Dioscorea cayenensis subsp. rotundata]|uniref:Uncharacterized protein LOC120250429 n=1 Tax=Dioscorea cayennensis subsp. rotundata TaxID=55577 RepID=A0AB40AJR4_DIOCR|nr:uncharacterized protein LOC120250429 [Dioscorea cayenensis subsp. rotundata]
MGNCLKPVRTWADDDEDWDFVDSENMEQCKEKAEEKTVKAGRRMSANIEVSSPAKVIKMKLTKKQLNELLQSVEMHDLLQDMTRRDNEYGSRLVLWRPVLQSIPEAEEC